MFVDLDRCKKQNGVRFTGTGCMYSRPDFVAAQVDWLQLGLLVCWVMCPEGSYHKRDVDQLYGSLSDPFLRSLIGNGMLQVE